MAASASRIVETREWGGLMLTLFLAIYAGLIAIPLGILLALGRRSRLPLIRFASVVFIEFWRGVPIITVIFLASLLLPLIMPTGFDVDRLARAVIGLAFVIAAYMAEAVRGGLQALPDGQAEAAQALGLGYWRIKRLIVLPQALRIALPAMTNEFIALFKNTTLVLIVSIFDLLGIAQAALADPAWVGMNMEAYVFAGAIYWFACFGLSQWSRSREKRLQAAYGRVEPIALSRRAVRCRRCFAALLAATLPAHAQTVDDIEQAWRAWMTKYGRKTGGLAVVHGGRAVREAAMGQEAVGAPVPVASLSKAVTGVCIADLIERGRLSFDTPLSQALARTMCARRRSRSIRDCRP